MSPYSSLLLSLEGPIAYDAGKIMVTSPQRLIEDFPTQDGG